MTSAHRPCVRVAPQVVIHLDWEAMTLMDAKIRPTPVQRTTAVMSLDAVPKAFDVVQMIRATMSVCRSQAMRAAPQVA